MTSYAIFKQKKPKNLMLFLMLFLSKRNQKKKKNYPQFIFWPIDGTIFYFEFSQQIQINEII